MTTLFGLPSPECQKEYCFLCIDRLDECCPCSSYNNLPEDEKFDLVDIDDVINDGDSFVGDN